jgi:hypothetical protein
MTMDETEEKTLTKAERMEEALISLAEYIFSTNDRGEYYHTADTILDEYAREINEVLDMKW